MAVQFLFYPALSGLRVGKLLVTELLDEFLDDILVLDFGPLATHEVSYFKRVLVLGDLNIDGAMIVHKSHLISEAFGDSRNLLGNSSLPPITNSLCCRRAQVLDTVLRMVL